MKLNYQALNYYVIVAEPILLEKLESGLTLDTASKAKAQDRMIIERGHKVLSVGDKVDLDIKPGDYVTISPSGFQTAAKFGVDKGRAILIDGNFITSKILDPTEMIKEDKKLAELKEQEEANTFVKKSKVIAKA